MKARIHRLKLIERLIAEKHISSQEQLQNYLEHEGYKVTQATLSRDLRTLQVWRTVDKFGSFRYMLPSEGGVQSSFVNESQMDVERGCLSLDFSGSLAVFRSPEGFASSLGLAIEHLGFDEILGVVAGFDTVFVALREEVRPEDFVLALREKVPNIRVKGYSA
ncbi:ArgR family transcriptional regulator [Entomospira nematocerorum]|uniref:Arginine repressor n=2 Tax=Entomospira TaxID=2834378 RepID=A0A968KSX6_9SPIO|nr:MULTISPECIES: ArgR family transcriptional regulator [Entomospira]NIZ40441.1 ArgR family transcriptional regulator [Entomospira entomophilus]NIZ47055.1 ArgR family transcriptional regulator [Entomospira nematocera]WDI34400.1 ArgR family transcriptional regulator [Entomospira nematocera]WDI35999.1 ArgR family transcriptional regulator [Entomospira entomophilus]